MYWPWQKHVGEKASTQSPSKPRGRVRRTVCLTVSGLLCGYLVLVGLVYAFQRKMVFPAPASAAPQCHPPVQYLVFDGPHGRRVHAVHFPAGPGEPTLVFFHGNNQTLLSTMVLYQALAVAGVGVYGVEYPGYGPAGEYSPSETALYEDAEAALERLLQRGVPPERTVLLGYSLGTGVAVEMARRGYGSRMILVAPFTSMADAAERLVPIVPAQWLIRDRFDSLSKAPSIQLPTLVVHGSADALVPTEMGRRVARAFPHAEFRLVVGADHNSVFSVKPRFGPAEIIQFARGRTAESPH